VAEPTAHLRIGFDTEFVRAGMDLEEADDAANIADAVLRGNEVLCYTAAIRNLGTGEVDSGIIELRPGSGGRRHRLTLNGFLAAVIDQALAAGLIGSEACRTRPRGSTRGPTLQVDLVAHFSRADLCGFKDWKQLRRSFDSVRGTLCTTTRPIVRTAWLTTGRPVVCTVRLYDSMLLAPAGFQSLEKLGELLGERKIHLSQERKARMDLVRKDDPELFRRYAIRDAVLAERWLGTMEQFFRNEFGLTGPTPATLASAGVAIFRQMAQAGGVGLQPLLGGKTSEGAFLPVAEIQDHISLIANCYHGGRNEAFWCGPTPQEAIWDIDIKGAYTTAMAGIRMPDWSAAEATTDLSRLAVIDSAIALARVRFRFPRGTRFPSLPVRAGGGRGLLYPLSGETHATGPELVVALGQGARIEVVAGIVIPFDDRDDRRPFAAFSRRIADTRANYRETTPAFEKAAKEIGNSLYGKVAQAVDVWRTTGTGVRAGGKRVFDARTGASVDLPPSAITSPPLAAWITGLVRAVCSECVASIPAGRRVYTLTTDGWLSSAPITEVDTTGPVARVFARLREIVSGDPRVLEIKHAVGQCVVVKTRGTFTVTPMEGYKPVLARAGQRMEQKYAGEREESEAWVDVYRNRSYDLKFSHRQLISLRDQWKHIADLVEIPRSVRVNLEFDFKRRLSRPGDRDGLLSADTLPWNSIEEFDRYREDFEAWRKSARRCCITVADFRDFEAWRRTRAAKREAGLTDKARRPLLVQCVLRAWSLRLYGLPGGHYRELAQITSRWWPTSADSIKKAGRSAEIVLTTEAGWPESEWVHAVAQRWPGINWFRFIDPWSWAAELIFGRDLAYWERQMEIPDPIWQELSGLPAEARWDMPQPDEDREGTFASPPLGANVPPRIVCGYCLSDERNPMRNQQDTDGDICAESAAMSASARTVCKQSVKTMP